MPQISISVSPDAHQNLLSSFQQAVDTTPSGALPPSFDDWLLARITYTPKTEISISESNDIYSFNAIERMVTRLHKHGYGLACYPKTAVKAEMSAALLASAIVQDLKLSNSYVKRLQDLFDHYQKDAKEIADAAQVGMTNRAYGAISEAFSQLIARTEKAEDNLNEERALGRVEGGIAILVSLEVMTRATASKKAAEFKAKFLTQEKSTSKETWVNKVFGATNKRK
ncbi:hypothetical protein [Herminiimonas aquatilis]|uniref:Uncharacterized protein n=1 Tax=Herminiimonas aquatilis TaxID=345342 RepID=A0ABW2J107_9BURK